MQARRRRASLSSNSYQSPLRRPLYRCRPPRHRPPRRRPPRRRPRCKWDPWHRSTAKPRIFERSMLHRARAMAAMAAEGPCHHHLVQAPTINIPRLAVPSKMRRLTCGGHWGVRSPRCSRQSRSKRQPSWRPPQRSCRSLKMLSARTGPRACAPPDNSSGRHFIRETTLNSGDQSIELLT